MLFDSLDLTNHSIHDKVEEHLKNLYRYKLVARKQVTFKATDHIDHVTSQLISNKQICFNPVSIVGDGNCLYRAISKALYGSEQHHAEIRFRTLCELVIRKKEFLEHCRNDSEHFKWLEHLSPGEDVTTSENDDRVLNEQF